MQDVGGGITYINFDYFFGKLYDFIVWLFSGTGGLWELLKNILAIFAVFFIFVIIYVLVRLYELRKKEREELMVIIKEDPQPKPVNQKWESVIQHMLSNNPAQWKLAVIEADTILDEMVTAMQYKGANLGEKLKMIEPADFNSLDSAWEAHKVRNRIAHEGSDFVLSKEEAERTIGLYEEVFSEFNYI